MPNRFRLPLAGLGLLLFVSLLMTPEGKPYKAKIKPLTPEQREQVQAAKKRNAVEKGLTMCELLVQKSLKDPDSYKRHIRWPQFKQTQFLRYSATNSFGGRIRESFDCRPFVTAALKEVS